MIPLLCAEGIGAIRGDRLLFSGVDLTISSGEAWLLRGANGAGKTTLLRTLAGLIPVESGKVELLAKTHWLGHTTGLKPHETPEHHLTLWAAAWGSTANIGEILSRMGLQRAREVPERSLSAGQKRRTAFARLLLVKRPIWLLDEPFTALDSDGAQLVADLIAEHRAAGGAVCAAIHGNSTIPNTGEIKL